jgi:hypothetical protein
MNNLDKHAAVLGGIEKITYYIVWARIEEGNLLIPYSAHDHLETAFVELYGVILTFIARSIRFLQNRSRGSSLAAADALLG